VLGRYQKRCTQDWCSRPMADRCLWKKCLWKLLGIKCYHHVWNDEVRQTTKQAHVCFYVCTIFWSRLTVTLALPADDWDELVLTCEPDTETGGVCSRSKSRSSYVDGGGIVMETQLLADDSCDEPWAHTQPHTQTDRQTDRQTQWESTGRFLTAHQHN